MSFENVAQQIHQVCTHSFSLGEIQQKKKKKET